MTSAPGIIRLQPSTPLLPQMPWQSQPPQPASTLAPELAVQRRYNSEFERVHWISWFPLKSTQTMAWACCVWGSTRLEGCGAPWGKQQGCCPLCKQWHSATVHRRVMRWAGALKELWVSSGGPWADHAQQWCATASEIDLHDVSCSPDIYRICSPSVSPIPASICPREKTLRPPPRASRYRPGMDCCTRGKYGPIPRTGTPEAKCCIGQTKKKPTHATVLQSYTMTSAKLNRPMATPHSVHTVTRMLNVLES